MQRLTRFATTSVRIAGLRRTIGTWLTDELVDAVELAFLDHLNAATPEEALAKLAERVVAENDGVTSAKDLTMEVGYAIADEIQGMGIKATDANPRFMDQLASQADPLELLKSIEAYVAGRLFGNAGETEAMADAREVIDDAIGQRAATATRRLSLHQSVLANGHVKDHHLSKNRVPRDRRGR